MPFRLLFHYVVILDGVTYRSKKRTGETLVSSSLALPGRASLPQNEKIPERKCQRNGVEDIWSIWITLQCALYAY